MIKVTRLNDAEYWLNPHLIESIEEKPDTTLTLLSGKKLIVKESPQELIDEIIQYRQKLAVLGNES